MSMQSIGQELVEKCNAMKNLEVIDAHYAEDVVSVEAAPMPGSSERETKGKAAVRGKTEWWLGAHEVHSSVAKGPYPHGEDRFAVIFEIDVTNKEQKQRSQMTEIGIFTVRGDKIAREEFFYQAG